jgi:hypothetical protein
MTKISNQYSLTNVLTADVVNGRVGINNGSPTVALDVTGAGKFSTAITAGDLITASYGTARIQVTSTTNSSNAALRFTAKNSGGTNNNAGLYFISGTTTANTFLSLSADDNNSQFNVLANGNVGIGTVAPTSFYGFARTLSVEDASSAEIQLKATGGTNTLASFGAATTGTFLQSATQPLITVVNGAERMRITSGGSVCIGTTTTGYKLQVEATSANYTMLIKQAGGDASYQPLTIWHAADSGNRRFIDFAISAAGNNVGSVTFNSSTGLTMYNTSSDYRLKSDIQDFNALDIIKNLKPKKYKMLNANNKSIGFIAHELQEFFPQAVSGEKDEERMQQVDYSQLTGLLTKAIQELSADLTSAKQEIELLKAK